MSRLSASAATIALLLLLAVPAAAHASSTQESIIEDEHQMLELGPAVQAQALDDSVALGADVIRVNVLWSRYAPSPTSRRRPKGFAGTDSAQYPAGIFGPLDSLVAGAAARGLGVQLTPTGPGPAWASRCRSGSTRVRQVCDPDPRRFGAFVRALGARYPQVTRWSIWNEPNQPSWLQPQYERVGGRTVPVAADLYRALARSAIAGLRATGHTVADNQILLGETSPIGRASGSLANRPVAPVPFISELLCLTSGARGCGAFKPFRITGFAHHPYTRGGSRPPQSRPQPGEITVSVASRLQRLLDRAGRRGRVPRKLPIWYTENGWQTNPPDRIFGVPLAQQAAYVNQSDWLASRNPRIRSVAQYKLVDDADQGSFQSGVRLVDGSPKPAYAAYRLPVWVTRTASRVTVWGQVRPAPDATPQTVDVQNAPSSTSTAWTSVQVLTVTSPKGQFRVRLPRRPGVWRIVWNGATSRTARAVK